MVELRSDLSGAIQNDLTLCRARVWGLGDRPHAWIARQGSLIMERTLEEPMTLNFRGGISPERAEQVITMLGEEETPSRRVTLRFEGYPYVNTGVGWRIGNALRPYSGVLAAIV